MKHLYKLPILLFSLIFLGGCFSKTIVETQYYLIQLPAQKGNTEFNSDLSDKFCEIDRVDIFPAYAGYKIANSNNSNKISYYRDHQWAVLPEDMLTEILLNFFENKMIFKGVSNRFYKVNPDYRMTVSVDRMEVIEIKEKFSAYISINFKLYDNDNMELLKERNAEVSKELESKNLDLYASALSELYYEQLVIWAREISKL